MDFLNYDIIGSWLSAMCADSAPVACARTNKCAQDKRPRQLSKKPVLITDLRTLLCPRKPQFQRPQNTVPARIHNPPAHKKFTTFSKLAASTLVARANPRRTGSHSHTPPTRPRTASARSCDRPSERLDREGSQHTAAPENAAAAPQNCEGQRHDCHEGRIQWGSHTQCESGRRRDGVNLRRRLREPDAQRR